MRERDWRRFLEEGDGKELWVAQLPATFVTHLGAPNDHVFLHHDYARKAVEKHGLGPEHFHLIFETIDRGIALADRDRHLSFFFFDADDGYGWFQVTVKLARTGRLYISTFYRQRKSEVERRLRLYRAVR